MTEKTRRLHLLLSSEDDALAAELGRACGIPATAAVLRFALRETCRLRGVTLQPPPPEEPRKRRPRKRR